MDAGEQRGRRAGDAGGDVGERGRAHVHVRVCTAAQSGGGGSSAACSAAVARLGSPSEEQRSTINANKLAALAKRLHAAAASQSASAG